MMFRALLPGLSQRYGLAGLALGSLLPAAGLAAEFFSGGEAGLRLSAGDPFQLIVFSLPFLFAAMFYMLGRDRERLLFRLNAGKVIERELLHMSLHDRLTGLPNRAALERETARLVAARSGGRMKPAFLLFDLDKFKHVNDTFGHDAGDELLVLFAARVQAVLGPRERIFRLGGDEFVVTVAGSPDKADLARVAGLIEGCADEPFDLGAGRAMIGVSIGVAAFEPQDDMADVMKRADVALYAAKKAPASAHVFHDVILADGVADRMRMEQEIASGLLNEEFFVEYQPVVTADTREIAGFEALVRWRHPRRGILTPEHFLGAAERSGQMLALGRFVLTRAVADAARWPASTSVSVNVTGDEFRDPQFIGLVRMTLARHGVAPERLTVEIAEGVFAAETPNLWRVLTELRSLGVKVAIDGFGMGLSGISRLRQLPIDRLKVDRTFTRFLSRDGQGAELVEIMLRLGKVFDIRTTVEGIESEDQFETARALGAADMQGYLISRPLAAPMAQAMACGQRGSADDTPRRQQSA